MTRPALRTVRAGLVGVVLAAALAALLLAPPASASPAPLGPERVVFQTTAGDIVLGLFPGAAPKTVAHVLDLARSGAYDGADFFRVVPGFIVQLDVNQRSSPMPAAARSLAAQTVPLETRPGLRHQRGVLSMAHYDGKPDSGGTGFSILLGDQPTLDGHYTVFGDVAQGMDVVDEIAAAPLAGSRPLVPIVITHAVVTDAAGVAGMTLRGPVPLGTGTSAGPVSTWPRLLLSTSMGDVLVTLSPRDAPEHVKLIESLVTAGAYTGAYLGRAAPGAYVQWFSSASGATTSLPVEKGTVGNVAGALSIDATDHEHAPALTFLLSDNHALDSRYTAIGWVTEGSDVLDAIGRVPTAGDHRPRQTVTLQSATIVPAGSGALVIRGLTTTAHGGSGGTPWAPYGFIAAAALLGFLIFVFAKRMTPAMIASAGLLVVAMAFLSLWIGLVPHAASSGQWLGIVLFAGAVGLFRLMGRFERGNPVPPVPPVAAAPPSATEDAAGAGSAAESGSEGDAAAAHGPGAEGETSARAAEEGTEPAVAEAPPAPDATAPVGQPPPPPAADPALQPAVTA
ncbi:MAG TPA: peptidylprolyl isomerase [Acidimicrobiales bacterium]|nr:peptidylprolyl isomerase [Acidimicrobiales bacterium]